MSEEVDPDEARRRPELAVLSLIAHADEPGAEHIAVPAIEGASDLDNDRAAVYPDAVYAVRPRSPAPLEQLMQTGRYEFHSDIARNRFAKGEPKGKAEGAKVLLQLGGRSALGVAIEECARLPRRLGGWAVEWTGGRVAASRLPRSPVEERARLSGGLDGCRRAAASRRHTCRVDEGPASASMLSWGHGLHQRKFARVGDRRTEG